MKFLKNNYIIYFYRFVLALSAFVLLSGCASLNAKNSSENGNYYFFSAKDYTKAAKYFEKAVKENPQNANYLIMLGWAYFKLDRYDDAISTFEKLEQVKANAPDAYTGRGWSYFKKLDYDTAILYFEKAIKVDPYCADAYDGIGWSSARKGDQAKAEANFNIALGKGQKYKKGSPVKVDAEAHRGLGYLYFSQNKFKIALKHFKTAVLVMPDWNDARVKWGDCLFALKRHHAACIIYNEALNYAKTAEIYDKIGWSHCHIAKENPKSNRHEAAKKMFNKALAFDPDYPSSLTGLSEVSEIEKDRWPQK